MKESLADLVIRYDIVKKLEHAGITHKFKKYMRLSAEEKAEIIEIVKRSELGVNRTLR